MVDEPSPALGAVAPTAVWVGAVDAAGTSQAVHGTPLLDRLGRVDLHGGAVAGHNPTGRHSNLHFVEARHRDV